MKQESYWQGLEEWKKIGLIIFMMIIMFAAVGFTTSRVLPEGAAAKQIPVIAPTPDPYLKVKHEASELCRDAILRAATNKSSVRFNPDSVVNYRTVDIVVLWKFTAKNGYGSQSTSIGQCETTPDGQTIKTLVSVDAL